MIECQFYAKIDKFKVKVKFGSFFFFLNFKWFKILLSHTYFNAMSLRNVKNQSSLNFPRFYSILLSVNCYESFEKFVEWIPLTFWFVHPSLPHKDKKKNSVCPVV